MDQELVIRGIAASSGVAIGKAFVFDDESMVVTKRRLTPGKIPAEIKRYRRAMERTRRDLNAAEVGVLKTLGRQHARLIEAHRLILEDPILGKDVPQIIEADKVNSEFALSEVLARVNLAFEALKDEFFRERRHDLFDVGRRILRNLQARRKLNKTGRLEFPDGAVVIARNLLPTDTIYLKEKKISGFATEMGSRTSHVAILSQSLELPAVVGAVDVLKHVATGDDVIVDGEEGAIYIRPSVSAAKHFQEKQERASKERAELMLWAREPAVTADGQKVMLAANVDAIEELDLVERYNAQGIGLLRTELVFMGGRKPIWSDVERQTEIYRHTLERMSPNPVVIRLLDIGADKLVSLNQDGAAAPSSSGSQAVGKSGPPKPEGLPMGLRGIRLLLRFPRILESQIRAVLLASPYGNARLMIPMVSAIEEVREVRWLVTEIESRLRKEGKPIKDNLPLGIMIEVPSVAISVETFLAEVDFVSVGTNDLVQYTLACDRASAELAYLYQEFHPSILKLLANIAAAARRMGRWVGICGEFAGNPLALPLLLGMGYDGLSVSPHLISRVKRQMRSLAMDRCRRAVEGALKCASYEEVVELLKREMAAPPA